MGSAAGASKAAHVNIPLPAPDHVVVSQVTLNVTAPKGKRVGPLKVALTNSSELGTPQVNTQAVAAISPKSSSGRTATFKVWIFLHRYPAPRAGDQPRGFAAQGPTADVLASDANDVIRVAAYVYSQSCHQLADEQLAVLNDASKQTRILHFDFLGDKSFSGTGPTVVTLGNLVAAFDTATEEQLDNAVFSKGCPGAENPSNDPPPI